MEDARIAFHAVILPNHIDMIIDSGASDVLFPGKDESACTDVQLVDGILTIGDKSQVPTYATAKYGILNPVILCHSLMYALVAVSFLTNQLKLYVFYIDNLAYILKRVQDTVNTDLWYFITVATATLQNDRLFHIDDSTKFLLDIDKHKRQTQSINYAVSTKPYLQHELKYGSAKVFHKSGTMLLNQLQWLHVRLGHAHEHQIKMMVKYGINLGTKVTYDEIKDLHLGECDTCMKCKMRAFALPLSISRRIYEVFEFLSCDHIPFSKTVGGVQRSFSIRGYTGIILFADRATGKIFNYLVRSKSEWLQCLKDCIAEYGPSTRNPRSVNLAYLQSDFATEVHSTEFAAFLKENRIKPLNSTPYKHAQNLLERFAQSYKNMIRTTLSTNDSPIRYWCYAAQYSAQTYNKLHRKGSTVSRDEAFYGIKADVSNCVPFYEHGWAYVSAEERASILRRRSTKALSERGVQVRCLGYADPYEIPNKSLAEAYIKNSYICLNLAENKIMPRHDCLWNTPTPGGLSNVLQNSFNVDDNVTSAAEEYDYDLLFDGPPRDYSNWQGENIVNKSIPDDPDGIIYTPESDLIEEEKISSDLGESLGESDTESEKSVTSSRKIKKRGRSCNSKSPPKALDPSVKNRRKHLQRKAKKSEAREAYMRKANYARIEASYGSRHPIADPEQIKIDSAIEAILATHLPKNDECQPDASSSYDKAAQISNKKVHLTRILMLLIVPLTLC